LIIATFKNTQLQTHAFSVSSQELNCSHMSTKMQKNHTWFSYLRKKMRLI